MIFRSRKVKSFLCGLIGGVSFGMVIVCMFSLEERSLTPHDVLSVYDVADVKEIGVNSDRKPILDLNLPQFRKPNDTSRLDPSRNIRILCWLYFRKSDNFDEKLNATLNTWGRKCNKFLIFVDQHNQSLHAIGLDKVAETVMLSDSMIISAYRYAYKHHFNDADWFFSAESIPYVIMENLRHFLSDKDPKVPIYYGHRMKVIKYIPGLMYADRCAGTVLSRAGLELLGTRGYSVPVCDKYKYKLGIQFAQCMMELGVHFGDTRDDEGRSRFLIFSIGQTMGAAENKTFEYRVDDEVSGRKEADRIGRDLISIGRSGVQGNLGLNFFIYDLIQVIT